MLGNPRGGQRKREQRGIDGRLREHARRMAQLVEDGLSREDASRRALEEMSQADQDEE